MKIKAGNKEFELETGDGSLRANGKELSWDCVQVKNGIFHVLMDGRSYSAEVLKQDPSDKSFVIRVNGNKYSLQLRDKYDELLQTLGMDTLAGTGMKELKAPMPGLVLDIRITEGQQISKGEGMVVLEAMKMENILKAAGDATVKKVHIKKGMTVEKNQVLISFS